MIKVLGLLICVLTASCIGWNVVVAGLSIKNLLLYVAVTGLVMQSVLGRRPKASLPVLPVCFAVLLGYAILTMCIVGSSGHLPRYNVVGAVRSLKATLIDWILCFFVMFYGTRTAEDAAKLMRILLGTMGVAQLITLWDAVGLPHIGQGVIGMDSDTRVAGFFGHANETGTLIATVLPAYVVLVLQSRGPKKIFWSVLLGASVTVLIATMSRGAIVGLLVGALWAAMLCRNYISFTRAMKNALIAAAIAAPILLIAGGTYVDGLIERFTGVSTVSASDVSSGRTIIWAQAYEALSANPMYFLTGVGWYTWFFSGMELGPHNQYLSIYFELGLIGLLSYLVIIWTIARAPLQALKKAPARDRAVLLAPVFSVSILAVGMLFEALGVPWIFLWTYFALSLRTVVALRESRLAGSPADSAANGAEPLRRKLGTMIPARHGPARQARKAPHAV